MIVERIQRSAEDAFKFIERADVSKFDESVDVATNLVPIQNRIK